MVGFAFGSTHLTQELPALLFQGLALLLESVLYLLLDLLGLLERIDLILPDMIVFAAALRDPHVFMQAERSL